MRTIHSITTLASIWLLMAGTSACSDNYDTSVVPIKTNLELSVDGHTTAFGVNYGAEPNNAIPVEVKSNTLWKVEISTEGGWCSSDKLTGRGDENFNLSILDNINKERQAFITIFIVDADGEKVPSTDGQTTSITMTLTQAVSDVRLVPSSFEPFKSAGNESQRVTIEANVAWTLSVNYEGQNPTEFIGVTPTDNRMTSEGDGTWSGTGEAQFDMTIADNRTAAERRAFLNLRSSAGSYSIEIIQTKSDFSFSVSRSDSEGVVKEEGAELSLELNSNFRWEATSPSWITVNPGSGDPTTGIIPLAVTVAPNKTSANRTDYITITPLPTQFAGGGTVDPASVGVLPVRVDVTQFGGSDPAISVPWLRDDYTQSTATVEFNFYSPFQTIVEAGLEWGREDSEERQTITTTPSNGTDATVSFELTDLDPATRYVARGYVKDEAGNVKEGAWSFPFTTAGQYPGKDDNPTPTK